jgi:hypothetical protein
MKTFGVLIAVSVLMTLVGSSVAEATNDLARARAATAGFQQLAFAQAAGYGGPLEDLAGITCITSPGVGVMGVHYVNGGLVGDATLDPTAPEVLVYQPLPNGKLRLVAAEYVVFLAAWQAAGNTGTPRLFGQPMRFINAPNRYGLPPFFEIHAWIWMNNPSGMFQDWNPSGSCA